MNQTTTVIITVFFVVVLATVAVYGLLRKDKMTEDFEFQITGPGGPYGFPERRTTPPYVTPLPGELPSETQPKISAKATEDTFTIQTPSGLVRINNILINPDYIPPSPLDWGVGVRRTPRYDITFLITESEWFNITILDPDVRTARKEAEQEFLKILGIFPADACKLHVELTVAKGANFDLAGNDYGLSFCPNGISF